MTRRLFVSDVHLTPAESPKASEMRGDSSEERRLRAFATLLRAAVPASIDEVYVLGDLCEMWIGDDDESSLTHTLASLFSELSQHLAVKFVAGNRDFLLGEAFAARTGMELLPDPCLLGNGTLISHGDSLCVDDAPYQQLRAVLRSQEWQQDILSKSLEERRAFGASLRAQSKAANANKAGNIMDVNSDAVAALVRDHSASVFIHGHTHRPGVHDLGAHADQKCQRVVLGAWERCAWWAVQEAAVELRCVGIDWLCQQSPEQLASTGALG